VRRGGWKATVEGPSGLVKRVWKVELTVRMEAPGSRQLALGSGNVIVAGIEVDCCCEIGMEVDKTVGN
jgi:hypothetical protein